MQSRLRHELKNDSVSIEFLMDKPKLKNALKQADKMKADVALILGDEELQKSCIQVKNLKQHSSVEISFENVTTFIKEQLS